VSWEDLLRFYKKCLKTLTLCVYFMQSEESVFLENPSNHLCFEAQVQLRKFLEQVLENGKVVDQRFFFDKENGPHGKGGFCISSRNIKVDKMAPRVLFPSGISSGPSSVFSDNASSVPESPHVYTSSPSVNQHHSPLRDLLSVSIYLF
jgi:hypothetical protein